MIEREFPISKSGDKLQYDIMSYVGEEQDTLMYIVNFAENDGWRIYSTDKRTPAILAEGDTGYFSIDEGSPAVAIWIGKMASDIAAVQHATDAELTFSKEEIEQNEEFWTILSPQVRDTIPLLPPGHWEETVYSSTVEYDHIDHMVGKWDQYAPYNQCCPNYVSTPNDKAVTGCVPLAGAQVLNYLHNKIGVPTVMPSEFYCIGNTDSYSRAFYNATDSLWSQISLDYRSYSSDLIPESLLIGHVGDLVGVHYCDDIFGQYSWALPGHLKNGLFEFYGISCSRSSYNENTVKSNLLKGLPVIVSATDLAIPVNFDIHCFVIDGYRRTRTQYTHHHYYIYDEIPSNKPYPVPPEYTTYTYSTPTLVSIKINWGWWTQWKTTNPVNDGWYALTGGWTVTVNGSTYDYNHNIHMTYGFSAS